MSFDKRLDALETHFSSGESEIIFQMGDGSTRVIPLQRGEGVVDIYLAALDHPESQNARLIAAAVSSTEPGGGRLIELANALLNGPNQTNEDILQ